MKTNPQIFAFHGWAFCGTDWKPWSDRLSDFGNFQSYDRGYFNQPREIEISNNDRVILIAHSFGLHFIEDELFEQADLLVVTGGFLHFHPYAAQYKRRSRLVLREMINNMEVKPEEVLEKFYRNCYAPQEFNGRDVEEINHQLMLDDLQELQTSQVDVELLKKAGKICILHGSEDQIVPKKKGREIYTQLSEKARYFEIRNAGHALPFTHQQQCLDFILPEVTDKD